jgi:hypothetical protein
MKDFTPCPKPEKPIRGTAECKSWMGLVAQLPCVICGVSPVELHHCAHGRYGQSRASDFCVIPLCPKHHRFRTDHAETWATLYGFDVDYLPGVKKAVERLKERTV